MATVTQSSRIHAPSHAVQQVYPEGSLRFDWIMTGLSTLFMTGLWVDGWAHFHGEVDDSFFTPWHFLFYSAFGIVALFLAFNHWRNVGKGYHSRRALPQGYWLSLVGAMVFALGGVGDMIWHTLFGIEEGSEALTSPTHLALALGMALVFSGALRSVWVRSRSTEQRGWRSLGPTIIAMTLLFTLVAFFTSYAHPVVAPFAAGFIEGSEALPQVSQLYVMNADGSAQTRLTMNSDLNAGSVAWSPDGNQMVYSLGVPGDNRESDLYIASADGSNPSQLTDAPGGEYSPAWSPDGTQIAYVGQVENNPEIFVMPIEGGEATRLTTSQGEEWSLDWSPDGTQIAYTIESNDNADIYLMNADGSHLTALTNGGFNRQPAWSPDGQQIVFTAQQQGGNDIYLMNADGSHVTRLTDSSSLDTGATFSADGQQIIFLSWRDGTAGVYTMPVSGEVGSQTKAVDISRNPALRIWQAEMSPDGSQILFVAMGQESSSNSDFRPTQDLGVISFLFQAVLMSGAILLLISRWNLPFGAITLLLTTNAILLTLLNDFFVLVPGALITGLIADILIRRWKLSPENLSQAGWLAFLIPLIYTALYFLTIQLVVGISWSIHVWAGAIVLSGLTGLLVSYLLTRQQPGLSVS